MPRSDYTLKTLLKGLEVLETLADDRDALTLTALAERLQESPPVVFRILRTLEERGYVEQDAGSKRWQPISQARNPGCQRLEPASCSTYPRSSSVRRMRKTTGGDSCRRAASAVSVSASRSSARVSRTSRPLRSVLRV